MNKTRRSPAVWKGLVSFGVCIVLLVLANIFLPESLGLYFSAIVEMVLILLALGSALVSRQPLKNVFPIRKPRWNHILGLIVLYYAGTYGVSVITYLTGLLFPEQMFDTINGMNSYMNSVPAIEGFVIVAILPPICEEALHRGFIMHNLSPMKHTAWKLILMGILFGVFHLEPYRFFITGTMGILLAYLMHETENLLIPALLHFVNNGVSFLSTIIQTASPLTDPSALFSPFVIGVSLCINGAAAPFLLYGGCRLLTLKGCRSSEKPFPHKKFLIIAAIVSGCCVVAGIVFMILGARDFVSDTILLMI